MRPLITGIAHLLRLALHTDRPRLIKGFSLVLVGYLATPLIAASLQGFTNAFLARHTRDATLLGLAMAGLLILELMLGHFAHLNYFELGEQQELALQQELLAIANGSTSIAHLDDPDVAETLTLIREGLRGTVRSIEAVLQLAALLVQVLITAILLGLVSPWLTLLAVAALPPVLINARAQRIVDRAKTAVAPDMQLSRHLVEMSTAGVSVKEIRLFRGEQMMLDRQSAAWQHVTREQSTAQLRAAGLRAAGHAVFALAYAAALFVVIRQAINGTANLGEVVLVVALAVQVSLQVATALGLLTTLQGAGRTVNQIRDLRAKLAPAPAQESGALPWRLARGIRLEHVGFTYPGTDRVILHDVTVDIPEGSAVAVVGENGAGKSTLVKLLCGLYQPTSGKILVDGVDLATLPQQDWQARIAMLFQDFARVELLVRENVGIGRVDAIDSDETLTDALRLARAEAIIEKLPRKLDNLLGHGYGEGTDLSGGEWQSLGLTRALLRAEPLVLALDEPAAALDAAAEHALFDRFVASSESAATRSGAITLFVSHRFSTARTANLIIVLDDGEVLESGSHTELMAQQGHYAELFSLQAATYR